MSDSGDGSEKVKAIQLVDTHTGDEIALGISASMHARPGDKASSPSEGKAMSGKGTQPLASAAPPPPPADAATSAKPAGKEASDD